MKVCCTDGRITLDSQEELRGKEFYHENGYVIFDRVVSPEICDMVLSIYERHADDDYATILNLDREVPEIQSAIMKHSTVVRLIEMLTDSEMRGCQTFFLFKKPNTRYAKQEFNPHQDNSYPRAEPGAYLAVDIPLTDQDAHSGGICLWPGTHKLGLLPFEEQTGYREKAGEKAGNKTILPPDVTLLQGVVGSGQPFIEDGERLYSKIDVTLKKGQAMIFDGNLIHASYPNHSDKWRPAIITNYIKADAEMIAGRTANRLKIPLR
jgi:ectoine hydroxylase-related dioxygenase (phytanoyl-CoA dioxygenase family)